VSYLMSGMYALPLCVPINRADKRVGFDLVTCVMCAGSIYFINLLHLMLIGLINYWKVHRETQQLTPKSIRSHDLPRPSRPMGAKHDNRTSPYLLR